MTAHFNHVIAYMILSTKQETWAKEICFHFNRMQLTAVLKENCDEEISRWDMGFLYNIKNRCATK